MTRAWTSKRGCGWARPTNGASTPVSAPISLAVSRDVSAGGIRFETIGCEIELGDVIRVTFNVGETTVVAVGRVAWATELDALTLDVGLEFIEIDPMALSLIEENSDQPSAA